MMLCSVCSLSPRSCSAPIASPHAPAALHERGEKLQTLQTLNLTDNRIGDAGRATLLAALGAEHADADGCSLPPLEVLRIDKSSSSVQEEVLF